MSMKISKRKWPFIKLLPGSFWWQGMMRWPLFFPGPKPTFSDPWNQYSIPSFFFIFYDLASFST
jgi:hypothetical protein